MKKNKPIIITMAGGTIESISNTPPDFAFEIHDYSIDNAVDGELCIDESGEKFIKTIL